MSVLEWLSSVAIGLGILSVLGGCFVYIVRQNDRLDRIYKHVNGSNGSREPLSDRVDSLAGDVGDLKEAAKVATQERRAIAAWQIDHAIADEERERRYRRQIEQIRSRLPRREG